MILNHRVIAVIPAGRRRTMSVLMKYLAREQRRGLLDGCQVWINTKDPKDLEWLNALPKSYPWVELMQPIGEWWEPKQRNTGKFYVHTTDPATIYVRYDDDIIYLHEDSLENLVTAEVLDENRFLTFGTIWNNAIVSWMMQREGKLNTQLGVVAEPYCMDPIGWASPEFGVHVHRQLIPKIDQDDVPSLYVHDYPLFDAHRFSISNFAYRGSDMNFLLNVASPPPPPMPDGDEEVWLAEFVPRHYGWTNVVAGNSLVSHFTFFTQREAILKTDILDQYRRIANARTQSGYYDMLPTSEQDAEENLSALVKTEVECPHCHWQFEVGESALVKG